MKNHIIILAYLIMIAIFSVGCNSELDERATLVTNEQPVSIYGFADDEVAMYYVNCRFDKIGECILELSVNIPNSDGTSSEELLNSKKVNVKKGANLLVDGVLVKDIENKVKEKTTIDYKDLKYHVKISEYSNGEKGTGVGSKWRLFKSNLE